MSRKDYVGLRSLRGIGAILIFYHHFGFNGMVTQSFGDFAVSLFFMLSGLVLAMSYHGQDTSCTLPVVGRFLRKRVIKIYPVYLLSLAVAMKVRGYNPAALPLDVLLLQSWVPVESIYFSGNSVSWFVSTLFFAYLLFLPLRRGLERTPGKFMAFFTVGLVIYFMIAATVPERMLTGIVYIFPVMELPTFILGMLIWHFMNAWRNVETMDKMKVTIVQFAVILIAVGFIYCYRFVDPRWSLASYWWLPNIVILPTLLLSEDHDTPVNRLLRLKPLRVMGDISFVFYLFHTLVIAVYRRVLTHVGVDVPILPSSLLCLVITFIVAYLLHYYLELPLARFLKKRIG